MRTLIAGLAFAATASIGWTQVDPARVVVVINGEEIKGAEYYRRMEFLPGVGQMLGDRFAEFPPGFMTIEQIINERLVYQLAQQKHCAPTDAEIQAELNRAKQDNPKLVDDWMASGRLMDDLLNQFKYGLAQFKLETNGITVTDQEVDAFYQDKLKTLFTLPKRVKLRVIVVENDAQKDAVDKALAAGTSFADVAGQYSVDVSKVDGGSYGIVPVDGMKEPAKTALADVQVRKTTAWISVETKSLKFFKEDVYPEKVLPLDDKLREETRRKMMLDRANAGGKNNIAKDMAEMRRNAQIDIKQKDFADAYKKFIEGYLKQQDAKLHPGGS